MDSLELGKFELLTEIYTKIHFHLMAQKWIYMFKSNAYPKTIVSGQHPVIF